MPVLLTWSDQLRQQGVERAQDLRKALGPEEEHHICAAPGRLQVPLRLVAACSSASPLVRSKP